MKNKLFLLLIFLFLMMPSLVLADFMFPRKEEVLYFGFLEEKLAAFILALIITLVIELVVAYIYLNKYKLSQKILISVLFGSVITLPFVWFVFPFIKSDLLALLFAEAFAFLFEAHFIYNLNRNKITFKKAIMLSLLANLASFLIGKIVFTIL